MSVVYDWSERGSFDEPWKPNYMHLLYMDGGLVIRVGYVPLDDRFLVDITINGSAITYETFENPREALDECQRWTDTPLPSVWLWRLLGEREGLPRARRVHTRVHEWPGGNGPWAA